MPRKNRGRNRKKGGKVQKEYCQGYRDKDGMWNNGFYCIKFAKNPGTKVCCGDQFSRFCCKQPGTGVSSTAATSTTPVSGRVDHSAVLSGVKNPGVRTQPGVKTDLVLHSTTAPTDASQTLDIPLIAGAAAGGAIMAIFLIILCCCICPCCPNKRRQRQRKQSKQQGISLINGSKDAFFLESREVMPEPDILTRDGTISDSDTISTAMYPVSPTPTSQTSIPSSNHTHDTKSQYNEPLLMTAQYKSHPYKSMMVSAVPAYLHDEIHDTSDILHTMKPITFGQLFPDMYPNEEIDPYTLTSGVPSLPPHDYKDYAPQFTNLTHGRYLRPAVSSSLSQYHSPSTGLRSHMHTNRYAL